MKKLFVFGVICLLCSISTFSQSKKEWERVLSSNSRNVYQQFILVYPNGKYTELAKQKLSQLKEEKKAEASKITTSDSVETSKASDYIVDPIYNGNKEPKSLNTNLKESKTSFVIGGNSTSFRTSVTTDENKVNINSGGKLGFQFGFITDHAGKQKVGLQNGFLVSFENFYSDWLVNCRVPLLGTYNADDKLSFQGGLNLDFWVCYIYDGDFEFEDESMNRWFNPSLSLGIEYKLSNKVSIYGSYLQGLTNMIKSEYSHYDTTSISEKKSLFQFGLKFNL